MGQGWQGPSLAGRPTGSHAECDAAYRGHGVGEDKEMKRKTEAMNLSTRHIALSAMLLALAVSSSALAADVETLPAQDGGSKKAARQCLDDLRAFDLELAESGFGVLAPGGYSMSAPSGYYLYGGAGTPRRTIKVLRDAAYVYAMDGDEASCQLVLGSMRKTYKQHQNLVRSETDHPDVKIAWRRAHLANAQPVTDMTRMMRADIVVGAEVRNPKDERLGEIKDLILDPARQDIAYVLVSRGGFLGLGAELVAVRWRDLRVTEDHELYVLNITKAAFDKAPTVDRASFERMADSGWRTDWNRFWDQNLEE